VVADDAPEADVLEQAAEIALEPDALPVLADGPPPELEDLPVLEVPAELPVPAQEADEPAVPVKKRRRAASRPAGSPLS